MNTREPKVNQHGATLIELVVSIVIISVATLGLTLAVSATASRSADPMIESQALAIAQGYMDEITQSAFCDPEFDPDGDPTTKCRAECITNACGGGCGGSVFSTEAGRTRFDDVCDYDGLADDGARDRNGAPLAELAAYDVAVAIEDTGVNLGAPALSAAAGETVRIDVAVVHPALAAPITISGFKANLR